MMTRRRRRHGFTLIEAMIVVAILGILCSLGMTANNAPVLESENVLVRERARQWLEYEADVVVHKQKPDSFVVDKLAAMVPRGTVTSTKLSQDGATLIEVRYRQPDGRDGVERLTVFGKGNGAP